MTWFARAILGTFVLALTFEASAVTTQPVTCSPTLQKAAFAYDSVPVLVGSDNELTSAIASRLGAPYFGLAVKLVAAETTTLRTAHSSWRHGGGNTAWEIISCVR